MLRLRPYRPEDAGTILSWCGDERTFYRWTAGMLGEYPLSAEAFQAVRAFYPFVAFDEEGPVGFFALKQPGDDPDVLRFMFVITAPQKRGRGYGRSMLELGLRFAFGLYGAREVNLGVFADNLPARRCYAALGFTEKEETKQFRLMGEDWRCIDMVLRRRR